MATTPSGLFSLPVDYLRKTVAGSAAFRTATGSASAAAALAYVHAFNVSGSSMDDPFYAVVEVAPEWARTMHAGGASNVFNQEGGLHLWFHQTIVTGKSESDAAYDFMNSVGTILAQMELLAGTAGFLDYREVRLLEGPFRPEEDEAASQTYGDFYRVLFSVEYVGT